MDGIASEVRRGIALSVIGLLVIVTPACNGGASGDEVDTRTTDLSTADADGYVSTPFGDVHRSCMFKVDSGEQLSTDGLSSRAPDGTVRRRSRCAYPVRHPMGSNAPAVNGWIDFSSAPTSPTQAQAFIRLNSQWNVPPAPPTTTPQILYFFTSFEPSPAQFIIQPVLQWGTSPAGGGQFWAIASWGVDSANNINVSTLVSVNVGDTIVGTITATSCTTNYGNCTWQIQAARGGQQSTLVLPLTNQLFTTVQRGVLEVRNNLTSCNQYPANTRGTPFVNFTNVQAFQPQAGAFNPNPQNIAVNVTANLSYAAAINQMGLECCLGQTSTGNTNVSLGTFFSRSGICHF